MSNPKFKPNRELRRLIYKYIKYRRLQGNKDGTIKKDEQGLHFIEIFLKERSIKNFNDDLFSDFIEFLKNHTYRGKYITDSTINSVICVAGNFFKYLSEIKGYKRAFNKNFIDLWKPSYSKKQSIRSRPKKQDEWLTIDNIWTIINSISDKSILNRRLRALIIYCFLVGSRIEAALTMKIKLLNFRSAIARQDHEEGVKTKNSKYIETVIPDVYPKLLPILKSYVDELINDFGFKPDDYIFTAAEKTKNGSFLEFSESTSLTKDRMSYSNAESILKEAFRNAGFPSFHSHSLRTSHINNLFRLCSTPADLLAVSKNVGHEKPITTEISYIKMNDEEITRRIKSLKKNDGETVIPNELYGKFKDFLKIMNKELYDQFFSNDLDHPVSGANDEQE